MQPNFIAASAILPLIIIGKFFVFKHQPLKTRLIVCREQIRSSCEK
jgi:hypothetical protein